MEIRIIRKGLEGFEYTFEPFEWDSKHLNANSSIRKLLQGFDCKFEHFKGIRSVEMQIRTIRKGFEAF